MAEIEHEYAAPLVNPNVSTGLDRLLAVELEGPVEQLAVYRRMGPPPDVEGGSKISVALVLPGVTLRRDGAPGTPTVPRGVTDTAADRGPVPAVFVAATVHE
jgi:hypothetical protein